jgi:dTDP-4-dehydrorhamnose reductase
MAPDNQTPRLLLTGKDGQVGFELQRSLAPLGTVIAVETRWHRIGRQGCHRSSTNSQEHDFQK